MYHCANIAAPEGDEQGGGDEVIAPVAHQLVNASRTQSTYVVGDESILGVRLLLLQRVLRMDRAGRAIQLDGSCSAV